MRRKILHQLFQWATGLCVLLAMLIMALLVAAVVQRGWPALSWGFFTEQIRLVGAAGGIFFNLIGTSILLLAALVVCTPLALALALTHEVYLRGHRWQRPLTLMIYLMNGVPSILHGILGLIVFVHWLNWGKSWLSGGIILGLIMVPTVSVALIERIAALPRKYVDTAASLGLRPSQIIRAVILPQCAGGLVTGTLIALARVAGETAPIMFTATIFAGATVPHGVTDSPVLSLPYHIFVLAQDSFDPSVGAKLWGTALTLLLLVFALSLAALPARLKLHEEARHG